MGADEYNSRALALGEITPADISELTRLYQASESLKVDGKLGPVTRNALRVEMAEPADQREKDFGPVDGPLVRIPISRRELELVAGNPGAGSVNRRWKRANIVSLREWPLLPSWRWVSIHRIAEPYLREALRRAGELDTTTVLEHCGGFVFRHVRNDTDRPLSLHAYGFAVDLNPKQNSARTFERGEVPVPFSTSWQKIWPDARAVDESFVRAFETAGWTWGGVWGRRGESLTERAKRCSYVDPMHFELRDRA